MTALPITLALPPLKPGEEPPACCPHCGGKRATDDQDDVASYACGAFYIFMQGTDGESPAWIAHRDCPTPRASAVLAALRSRGEPAWQKVVMAQDGTESIMADWSEIDDGIEGAADWFAKQGL